MLLIKLMGGLKEILITLHPAKNKAWTKSYAQDSLKRFTKRIKL